MSLTVGNEVQFEAGATGGRGISAVILDSSNALIFYSDGGDGGKAKGVHADLSTEPPTIGTPAVLSTASSNYEFDSCKLTATKALVVWNEGGAGGAYKLIVAELSGTTVSFGTAVNAGFSAGALFPGIDAVTSTDAVLVYGENGVVVNVSGTTITVNTPQTLDPGAFSTDVVALSSTTALVAYQDSAFVDLRARMLTGITTTTFTTNTEYQLDSSSVHDNGTQGWLAKLDSSTIVAAYQRDFITAAVAASISGTVITPGTAVDLTADVYDEYQTIAAMAGGTFAICYDDTSDVYIHSISVSGTTITDNADRSVLSVGYYLQEGIAGDGGEKGLVAYSDGGSNDGQARLLSVVVPLEFYYGTNGLTYRSDLNITDIERDAMLVRSDGTVLVGSGNAADSVVCEFGTAADNYATWTDITDNLGPGPVTSIREV